MREGLGHRDDTRFRQRLIQHTQKDLLFELRADGTYHMMEMTVRDACNYVHGEPYSKHCCSSVCGFESAAVAVPED